MDNEYSIKLRMEKISRSRLFMMNCFFFLAFIVCIVLGCTIAPPIINSNEVLIHKCDKVHNDHCYSNITTHEVWQGKIPHVNHLNQILYMTATPTSSTPMHFNMSMQILVLHKDKVLVNNERNSSIVCTETKCNTLAIFYLPYLDYKEYDVIIKHRARVMSDGVEISLSYVNSMYTKYQLITKYCFFILSLVSFVQYLVFSLKVPLKMWSFEAKALLPLGASLIIFNEPLLFAAIYFMSPLWSSISVFCNTQFLAGLLIFWLVDLQHYRKFSYNIFFLIFGIILVAILFVLIFNGYLYVHEKFRFDPTYDWQHDLNHKYYEIFMGIIILAGVLLLWILFLCCRALRQIYLLSAREVVMKKFNILVILFCFLGIGIGAFQPIPQNSSLLLIFVSGMNFYVILLQFMYSPTSSSILEYVNDKNVEYSLVKSHENDEFVDILDNSAEN